MRGTKLSWEKVRRLVWERDNGTCQVCHLKITLDEYDCGHVIDRMLGGSDRPDNLVCMCRVCNQLKPPTKTRQEYIEWAGKGGPIQEMISSLGGLE